MWVRSLALSGLGSGIALAVLYAGSCSSNSFPNLETPIYHRCVHKKEKEKDKNADFLFADYVHPSVHSLNWALFGTNLEFLESKFFF